MNIKYHPPDYYNIDELLTDEQKIIRNSVRDWVSRSVVPIIDKAAQEHKFPINLIREMGEIGVFGPYIPEKYGGAGLDKTSYGLIMT